MKKIVYAILATVAGLVLLFSYRTSLNPNLVASPSLSPVTTGKATTAPAPSTTPSAGASASSPPTPSATPSAASSSGMKDGTFTGQAADTPYGPLQVQIVVSGGRITTVNVPEYPNGSGRDQEINAYAIPQLVQETTSAQNANVDMVSGATFTSQGYLQSLQSAIDQATA